MRKSSGSWSGGRPAALLAGALMASMACGPRAGGDAKGPLTDVRFANGRPPVVVVAREGDPAAAVAVAITTAGLENDDPEPATALAGLIEARLKAKSIDATVTPSWDGLRTSTLATSDAEAVRVAEILREVLTAPATDADLASARKKLTALAGRPLRDRALSRWARCVGEPHALPERAGKETDLDVAKLERWRSAGLGLGRVAIAVTGPGSLGEAVAGSVLRGPIWKGGAAILTSASTSTSTSPDADVFDLPADVGAASLPMPMAFITLDVGSSSAAVTTAEALGDPKGPLAARLSELDLPFRLREVIGAAHVRGGCVGAILEASPGSSSSATADLAARVADAAALVQLEASVHLAGNASTLGEASGPRLSRRSGDARDAAERAAWWALVDQQQREQPATSTREPRGTSLALGVPSRRGSTSKDAQQLEPSREALAGALTRAAAAWEKPVVEARSRVEAGQGEAWILIASPCGTEGETDADAGLSALFATAVADGAAARATNEARVEPWVVADGVGLLVHGPPLAGESAAAHARRLADVAARSFAAEPIASASLGHARADLLRRDAKSDGPALSMLAAALAPQHPSWVVAWGASEPLARSSDSAVLLRAQALRSGPIRMAILANTDASQADAAVRAADRWIPRRGGDARTCRAGTGSQPSKPGTYAAPLRPGAMPEAYLAFPFAPGDEPARAAASVIAASLDGDGALLDKALSPNLARESSARILGWPKAPALVVRVVAPQASLDGAVMQARALIDRIHKGGLAQPDFDRATQARARGAINTALDPRARVVATWRGEPLASAPAQRTTIEDVRAFAQKSLAEDAMVIVASRPPRPPPASASGAP